MRDALAPCSSPDKVVRAFAAILISLVLPSVVCGNLPPPAWHLVEGRSIQFFKEKGFEFSVDDSMAHHYEKPTVEISILIPDRFTDSDLTNTFSGVQILSDDISTELGTHEHAGKKRSILTISEELTKKSKVAFYFRNNRKGVTGGSMYRLDLARVLEEWRKAKK